MTLNYTENSQQNFATLFNQESSEKIIEASRTMRIAANNLKNELCKIPKGAIYSFAFATFDQMECNSEAIAVNFEVMADISQDEATEILVSMVNEEVQTISVKLRPVKRNIFRCQMIYMIDSDEYFVTLISVSDRLLDDYDIRAMIINQVEKAIVFIDEDGYIRYWNKYATYLYGYEKREAIGRRPRDIISYDIPVDKVTELMKSLLSGESWTGSFMATHKSGKKFIAKMSDTPIRNINGKVVGIVGVSFDNTTYELAMQNLCSLNETLDATVQRRTEELSMTNMKLQVENIERKRIQEECQLLSLVTIKTNSAVAVLSNELEIEWLNDSFIRGTGLTMEDVKNKRFSDIFNIQFDDQMRLLNSELFIETQGKWFNLDLTPITVGDSVNRFIVIFSDITKQKQLNEEYKRASRLKTEFITTISHELRTPLNGILGSCSHLWYELVRGNPINDLKDGLSIIMSCSHFLLIMVNNILDFQKIEAGKLSYKNEEIDVISTISRTIKICSPLASVNQIQLVVVINEFLVAETNDFDSNDVSVSFEPLVGSGSFKQCGRMIGDSDKISQILLNLVCNAIKFTKQESVIKIHTRYFELNDKKWISFSVCDQGSGIHSTEIHKLFKQFSQLNGSNKQQAGSGLGLNICRKLANIMGGDIWVHGYEDLDSILLDCRRKVHQEESECVELNFALLQRYNKNSTFCGAIFHVVLPLLLQKEETVSMKRQFVEGVRNVKTLKGNQGIHVVLSLNQDKFCILIAEDNPINQKVLSKLIQVALNERKVDYVLEAVNNGKEAVDFVCENHVDVVFMDLRMPVLDGIEATKEIVRRFGKNGPLIIAASANVVDQDIKLCLDIGMNGYISKPLTLKKVKSVFEDLLLNKL